MGGKKPADVAHTRRLRRHLLRRSADEVTSVRPPWNDPNHATTQDHVLVVASSPQVESARGPAAPSPSPTHPSVPTVSISLASCLDSTITPSPPPCRIVPGTDETPPSPVRFRTLRTRAATCHRGGDGRCPRHRSTNAWTTIRRQEQVSRRAKA